MDEHSDGRGRFRDPQIRLYELAANDIYVACPRCGRRAVSAARPTESRGVSSWPRSLICPDCAYSASWHPRDPQGSAWGGPVDPFFRQPLWLQTQCCGGRTLWAFNRPHLDLLEGHLAAALRERGEDPDGLTLVARLPAWMKFAKNRDEVLRGIGQLRAGLDV